MPFINLKTNVTLDENQKHSLKSKLTKSITLIPGKSENYVMCAVEDNVSMMFRGDNTQPLAFVEIKILHSAPKNAYAALTEEICKILKENINVDGNNCYVKFEEAEYWGMDGFMF